MKKTLYILIAIITLSSCSKSFLTEVNPNSLGQDTYWQTTGDVDRALAGVYGALQAANLYNGAGDYTTGGVIRLDIITDDCYANWNYIDGASVARGDHSPRDGFANNLWAGCYKLIFRSNDFLENVDRVTMYPQATRNIMKSEVRFLRALAYQTLAMVYRDVPLITHTQTLATAAVAKNTNAEINAFIESELLDISSGSTLTATAPQIARVDLGSALSLLARQYLYEQKYTQAAATALQVINLGKYNLNTPYNTLFKAAGESSGEIIFRVAYLSSGPSNAYEGYYAPAPPVGYVALPNLADDYYFKDGKPKATSTLYNPTNELLNRDPRFDATLVCSKGTFRGATVSALNLAPTNYRVRKYTDETTLTPFQSGQDFYVIRYPEVLLTRAEALVESGTYVESEVDGLINQVRARATMPTVQAVEGTGLTQAQLRAIIRHERRVEFAFEGLRFFDLKRWGIYEDQAVTKYDNVDRVAVPGLENRLLIGPKHQIFPIPQRELDVNPALVQAPEWQ